LWVDDDVDEERRATNKQLHFLCPDARKEPNINMLPAGVGKCGDATKREGNNKIVYLIQRRRVYQRFYCVVDIDLTLTEDTAFLAPTPILYVVAILPISAGAALLMDGMIMI